MSISATSRGLKPGVCTSTNRPANPYDGMMIYETDTDKVAVYDVNAWVYKTAASVASAGSMTLLSTTTLSGASTTISSISGDYINLVAYIRLLLPATDVNDLYMRFNSDTTTKYRTFNSNGAAGPGAANATSIMLANTLDNTVTNTFISIQMFDYANTSTYKLCNTNALTTDATTTANMYMDIVNGAWFNTAAITSITFFPNSGNFTSGTVLLYGVK